MCRLTRVFKKNNHWYFFSTQQKTSRNDSELVSVFPVRVGAGQSANPAPALPAFGAHSDDLPAPARFEA